ncbi:MAG: hypothetical protein GY832_03345 [Chloroflexi bacterium]|nr:hypothetical protein [Chloroflexota bacterium]
MESSIRKSIALVLVILIAAGLFFLTIATVQGQAIEQPPATPAPDDQTALHHPPDTINPSERDSSRHQAAPAPQRPASTSALAPVLLILDNNPWNTITIQNVLNRYRIPYDMIGSSDISATDISPYPVVIIPSVQNTSYYSTYDANISKFETYVTNGGILEFHGATYGYAPLLPGGVLNFYDTNNDNYVEEPDHPLVSLVEDVVPNPFPGGAASHNYFSNTITGTTIICTQGEVSGGNPTLIEYPYGDGFVIASGQTMEYYYPRQSGAGLILPNMILYAYSRATGLAMLVPGQQHRGDTPGSVVSYTMTLWNLTGITDTFDLTVTGNVWPTTFWDDGPITRTGTLSNYGSADFSVQVSIPPGASSGDVDTVDIQATSVTSPTDYASTAAITTSAICGPNLAFSGQSEMIRGNLDDVYDYGGQAFAQVYVYVYGEANNGYLDAVVSGYDPGSDAWQVIAQQVDGVSGGVANHYPFSPSYTAVRVQLDDTDNNGLVWYDYDLTVCREPAVDISPQSQENLGHRGTTVIYTQTVSNYTMVSDSFDLTIKYNTWPVTLWSNGAQISDTGTLVDQETFTVSARIEVPADASAGDADKFIIQAQSTTDPSISDTTFLRTTVIARQWVQAFSDNWSPDETYEREQYLDIVGTSNVTAVQMTDDTVWQGGPPVVAAYPQYSIVAAWGSRLYQNDSALYHNIEYAAFDLDGRIVSPVTRVSDNISVTTNTFERQPTLAVDPVDGAVLVAWHRDVNTDNVYYAMRNKVGGEIAPPTALTTDTTSAFKNDPTSAAAFGSGGFVIAWEHENTTDNIADVHYAVISRTGEVISGPIQLTHNTGSEDDYRPRANRLADGNVMLTWYGSHGSGFDVYYAVVDSAGDIVHPITQLTDVSNGAYDPDAVGLKNGNTIVVWRQAGYYPEYGSQPAYAVLNSAYSATIPITTPVIITNTLSNDNYDISIARDGDDNAVLTWMETSGWHMYYALVDNGGTVQTWPMVLRTTRNEQLDINLMGGGSGSFPTLRLPAPVYLPTVLKNL